MYFFGLSYSLTDFVVFVYLTCFILNFRCDAGEYNSKKQKRKKKKNHKKSKKYKSEKHIDETIQMNNEKENDVNT